MKKIKFSFSNLFILSNPLCTLKKRFNNMPLSEHNLSTIYSFAKLFIKKLNYWWLLKNTRVWNIKLIPYLSKNKLIVYLSNEFTNYDNSSYFCLSNKCNMFLNMYSSLNFRWIHFSFLIASFSLSFVSFEKDIFFFSLIFFY